MRLEFLASIFGIDCLTYCVMSNHLHLILRSRPDVVATWSDQEVARRWLRLFPKRRGNDGPPEPKDEEVNALLDQPERVTEIRRRLSDISWWMRCTAENIARLSNREDEVTGHFWESRYRSQVILDEAGLLACAAYVDLNPVRAALAETPEASEFTGVKDRIDDLKGRTDGAAESDHRWERNRDRLHSGWMSPIEINEREDPVGPDPSPDRRRASWKGFLSIPLRGYLQLVDWTGRQFREDKVGSIPESLAPILKRVGLDAAGWCELIQYYAFQFKRAVGSREHLQQEATRRGQRWLQHPGQIDLASG
jgi:REP element-mobilizing transposase RayT